MVDILQTVVGLATNVSEIIAVLYGDMRSVMSMHASAVFGLLGAVVGGVLSYITSKRLKSHEFTLQVRGKLLDRQIAAHEDILKLAIDMRIMTGTGELDTNGEVIRFPVIISSQEQFLQWFTDFTNLQLKGTTWLSTATKREVNFVQDYLINLQRLLKDVHTDLYPHVGRLIVEDFRDISNKLEKIAYQFFEGDVSESKLASLNDWHKYQLNETKKRLMATKLIQNEDAIKSFAVKLNTPYP